MPKVPPSALDIPASRGKADLARQQGLALHLVEYRIGLWRCQPAPQGWGPSLAPRQRHLDSGLQWTWALSQQSSGECSPKALILAQGPRKLRSSFVPI
jgi:hypothetical protein